MAFPTSNTRFPLLFILSLIFISPTVNSDKSAPSFFLQLPSNGDSDSRICPIDSNRSGYCPVKCFRPDPVCGEDGVTYWCGCSDAHCAGTRVAKAGFCEVGSGGSGALSGQALLLVHIVWLIVLGFSLLFGFL